MASIMKDLHKKSVAYNFSSFSQNATFVSCNTKCFKALESMPFAPLVRQKNYVKDLFDTVVL